VKRLLVALAACALAFSAGGAGLRGTSPEQTFDDDGVREFLNQLELAVQSGLTSRYMFLVSGTADRLSAHQFGDDEVRADATRVVIQERERLGLRVLTGTGYRLIADVFVETGHRAREVTWQLDIVRADKSGPWRIDGQRRLTGVDNLYHLTIDPAKQYAARDLTIAAEDLEITLANGSVFVVDTDQGVTGVVLLGGAEVRFHPAPATEQTQLKIFCGSRTLDAHADALFVRINPDDFAERVGAGRLTPRAVDPRALARAEALLREDGPKSFGVDLADLSRDWWSIVPAQGDFLAEIHTRRYGTLTYARSGAEPEDITLFHRKLHRNIALYTSAQRLAQRGRFYDEDAGVEYDVLDYDIDLSVAPDREWIDGLARVHLKVRSAPLASLTLRLAEPLVVRSIVSDQFGRLFGIRVSHQNSIVVNLPATIGQGAELMLTIAYSGRLPAEPADRETVTLAGAAAAQSEAPLIPPEPSYLYTNNSYWYPQSSVTDYATATLRITLPSSYDCVGSGELAVGSPVVAAAKDGAPRKTYVFIAAEPVRYLAFLVSRFTHTADQTIALPNRTLKLAVEANPREAQLGREYADRAADIVRFYASLLDDCPYPSLTLAIVESERPGGHSPAYFAAINQPPMDTLLVARHDPEVFANYPEFYVAHEVAHQWWGQAVGWNNYHERWLSEGFAQYFAALYARQHRGDRTFAGVMRQLRQWGMRESPEGPIYLGYRLGHIRGESKVFSALVYNKSAAVLHMLRRLVGDEAFFRGVRRFYRASRFRKAGTEDLRRAMEAESARPLERFFERWIYGSTLPTLKFSSRVDGDAVVLHVEQIGELFDVPLTVTLQYADGKSVDVVVPVTERTVEMRVALAGRLRRVSINKDDGTLADVRD
jgi:Peptidase family M1 domain